MQGGHFVTEVVGNKTLIEYCGRNQHGHHLWVARCNNCGEVTRPDSVSHLKRATYCDVCQRWPKSNGRWSGYEGIPGTKLSSWQDGARVRGLEWSVTPEELWDKWITQDGLCAYTGWKLVQGATASLDRIDSSLGYLTGNVQWVHKDINRMKSNFTEERFLELCSAVYERKRDNG